MTRIIWWYGDDWFCWGWRLLSMLIWWYVSDYLEVILWWKWCEFFSWRRYLCYWCVELDSRCLMLLFRFMTRCDTYRRTGILFTPSLFLLSVVIYNCDCLASGLRKVEILSVFMGIWMDIHSIIVRSFLFEGVVWYFAEVYFWTDAHWDQLLEEEFAGVGHLYFSHFFGFAGLAAFWVLEESAVLAYQHCWVVTWIEKSLKKDLSSSISKETISLHFS